MPRATRGVAAASTRGWPTADTSSNTALVPNNAANLNVSGSGSSRTLTNTPVANQNGTTIITVTVNSASGSMTDTFVLTVNGVNDPPSFTKGPDQTVAEDSGPQTVPNWATNISPGPSNESGQTLTFVYCNGPIEIVENRYGALPFAIALGPTPGAQQVLPPRTSLCHLPALAPVAPSARSLH